MNHQAKPMATSEDIEKYIAARIAVHPRTVRRWIREGKGPAHIRTPGGHRRYNLTDVDQWITNLRATPYEAELAEPETAKPGTTTPTRRYQPDAPHRP